MISEVIIFSKFLTYFVIKLDGNKDFKMLRKVVNMSYITLRSIFIIKLGVN